MPFDFEHKATRILAKRKQLKIGIVGFGKFGQFLAQRLVQAGHQVGDHSVVEQELQDMVLIVTR